ncbi:MAG: hypothetical protein Q8K36_00240, partial [Alphaproteobacteria bacterium]|nr:hypothetical protein [Alphaproteobacteria bacterium]
VQLTIHNKRDEALPAQTELTYTTDDIKWRSYYTGHLSNDQKHITVSCWLVIQNQTQSMFANMNLVLFDQNSGFYKVEQHNIHDHYKYNRYQLPHAVSLHPMKETRILWLQKNKIPLRKEYMIDLGGIFLTDLTNNDTALPKVDAQLSWENGDQNLPQGPMTIYQINDLGRKSPLIQTTFTKARPKQRIGVMMPAHLKINESNPIDIHFEQTDFQKYTNKYTESANRLTLTNKKDYPISVKVFINLPSDKSTIFRDNIHHQSDGGNHKYWIFELAPLQKINLLYRARIVS